MVDLPCGVVGFYTQNGEPRSSVVAVGVGSSVYIFKNMRPYFKYCLPHIEAHPKEREVQKILLPLNLKTNTFSIYKIEGKNLLIDLAQGWIG